MITVTCNVCGETFQMSDEEVFVMLRTRNFHGATEGKVAEHYKCSRHGVNPAEQFTLVRTD